MAEGKVIKLIPEEITEAPDGSMIQIVTRVFETQDEFIFETIRPFCETQAHMAITKDELIRALTLLREQEPVKPIIKESQIKTIGGSKVTWKLSCCGWCGTPIEEATDTTTCWNYCPNCGRRIEWNA